MATRVADFVLVQDHASRIPHADGVQAAMRFDAAGAIGDGAVVAFKLAVEDAAVKLQIAFNGANLFGGELTIPPSAARSFHEIISQTPVREQANDLIFSARHGGGTAVISDVVVWYRRMT